jgi:hypothetical protein
VIGGCENIWLFLGQKQNVNSQYFLHSLCIHAKFSTANGIGEGSGVEEESGRGRVDAEGEWVSG